MHSENTRTWSLSHATGQVESMLIATESGVLYIITCQGNFIMIVQQAFHLLDRITYEKTLPWDGPNMPQYNTDNLNPESNGAEPCHNS